MYILLSTKLSNVIIFTKTMINHRDGNYGPLQCSVLCPFDTLCQHSRQGWPQTRPSLPQSKREGDGLTCNLIKSLNKLSFRRSMFSTMQHTMYGLTVPTAAVTRTSVAAAAFESLKCITLMTFCSVSSMFSSSSSWTAFLPCLPFLPFFPLPPLFSSSF